MVHGDAKFAELTAELVEAIDAITDAYFARFRDDSPEWTVERPELESDFRRITRSSILDELVTLRDGGEPPSALPAADLEFARVAARLGGAPHHLSDAYRRGHAVQWAAWFDLVEDREPDPARRRALLRRGSDFFFVYAAYLSRLTLGEYTEERDRMMRHHEQRRVSLVGELLAGRHVTVDALDYDPGASNLALIAWGPAAAVAAEAAARALGRRLLLVSVIEETLWGWLGGEALDARARRALARLTPIDDAQLAFGDDLPGADGFRASHRQALHAKRAGQRTARPVTHYGEVALEALAAGDPDEARAFVVRELRGLEGDDARARRLRETLRAWFAAGQNAAATAAALGVHEQTVAARLRAVEERTGAPPAARRAELETALRLREYLG
jgi:hypothetical protein